jgi:NTE family protein
MKITLRILIFSPSGIRSRWESGYANTMRAIERHAWEDESLEGMILHETEHT